MTFAAEFQFLLGKYHATSWDRNVNDGESEWPPSPWRICRALYAVWKDRCPDISDGTVLALLGKIAQPPTYFLPPWGVAATRHYYPDYAHKPILAVSVDKVIDSFVAVPREAPVIIEWPGTLEAEELSAFSKLLGQLSYLGRAESVVEARSVESGDGSSGGATDRPGRSEGCVDPPKSGFQTMRPDEAGETAVMVPRTPILESALTIGTDAMRSSRHLFPAGATLVTYSTPEPPEPGRPSRRSAGQSPGSDGPGSGDFATPTTMILMVAGRPAPHIHEALSAAERVRSAWNSVADRDPTISGHGADGTPLDAGHKHVHLLPIESEDRRIGAFVAWAPGGLSPQAVQAIARVTHIREARRSRDGTKRNPSSGEREDGIPGRAEGTSQPSSKVLGSQFWLTLVAVGHDDPSGGGAAVMPRGILGPSSRWASVTPFVPGRHQHPKRYSGERTGVYMVDFVAEEVNRELAARGLPPTGVKVIDGSLGAAQRFTRYRAKDGLKGARPGVMLELEFEFPVLGPISIGRYNHFGLGLFQPLDAP